ncbi:MAG: 1-deoxy-D-xylulose-5-phosphate synthase [Oscillospiraceae bacterium]|nr:1-deoxy-D-xylulose-5-phosphate synthase [Oscillospiraceae bacterium]
MSGILESVRSPEDVKRLEEDRIPELCEELRRFLVERIAQTGGHLASNLGVVELTVAIHRVFDTAKDRLVFDVGHQCYVHKLLTGRQEAFDTLRQYGGLAGFPKPKESIHDAFVAGHASTAVSQALGMARARTLSGEDYHVLALVGDGAMGGGAAFEGLDDAGASGEPLVVILNDNGMAIRPSVGGLSRHLANLRLKPGYRNFKRSWRSARNKLPWLRFFFRFAHKIKESVKSQVLRESSVFEHVGMEYLGPVDGHNVQELEEALRLARSMHCPVLLHVITQKGKGYAFAEEKPEAYHGVSCFDAEKGAEPSGRDFAAAFGDALGELAAEEPRLCAVTAAMETGTGLSGFAGAYPERFFDVGIAEEHAVSMAAGLAARGRIPAVAIYSTFLQRAYDMLLQDIALPEVHAVLAVDRSGFVGADGETHHGLFDTAYLSQLPGVEVWAPASYSELRDMLRHAVLEKNGPVALKYPRGREGVYTDGGCEAVKLLREGRDAAIVTFGMPVNDALEAAELLAKAGVDAAVVKLGRINPLDCSGLMPYLADRHVLVLEENIRTGGIGERIAVAVLENRIRIKSLTLKNAGDRFVPQGTRRELMEYCGMDAQSVSDALIGEVKHGRETA